MNTVKFIGMDVHKKTITIAIADEGRQKEPRIFGTVSYFIGEFCCYLIHL
ncbi:MAG: hypothetical protein SWH54_20050 [Thermodesulfobacteriota bacterium]|nr:hypothetical protein [Thermodesulfobacteriota bacterium]